ncbi:MAG: hexosyltransferase [Alphaproteobacteria bacterium]|nr:hexosyltransferase [Alphaproteobacteria bacterium]
MTEACPDPRQRHYDVAVVTTAALPWRTGPSYFSLWHAAGLKAMGLNVVYVIPWVEEAGQSLWGGPIYKTFEDQASALHEEAQRIGCPPLPDIVPYKASVWWLTRSIMPTGDIFRSIPSADALILHEPEHLGWIPWTTPRRALAANKVVGIVMTNYADYVRSTHKHRAMPAWLSDGLARFVTWYHRTRVAKHTDIAIPLSGAVAEIADVGGRLREAQVTGVSSTWRDVEPVRDGQTGIYFLGRLIWEKGLADLIEIACRTGHSIDVIGDGADQVAVKARACSANAPLTFLGPSAEPWTRIQPYKTFFNPSTSEVLCTTTAEALVAGRHVVIPECPANEPFRRYPNTHFYTDMDGACAALDTAIAAPTIPPEKVRDDFHWPQACRTIAALCDLIPIGQDAPLRESSRLN